MISRARQSRSSTDECDRDRENTLTQYWLRVVLLMAYFGALAFAFHHFILVKYAEDKLELRWITTPDTDYPVPISIGLALVVSLTAAASTRRARDVFLLLHAVVPVLPMLVVYASRGAHTQYMVACVAMYLLVVLVAKAPFDTGLAHITGRFRLSWVPLLVVILAGMFVAGNLATGGLRTINFSFDDVYEFRRAAQDTRGVFLTYLSTNLVAFLIGFGCVVAYAKRKYIFLAAILSMNLIIFGLTSHKSHFFAGLFALAIYVVMTSRRPLKKILVGAIVICVASVILFWIDDSLHRFGTYSVRRIMFVPSYINFLYYDFFVDNPLVYWSDTKVGLGLVPPAYDVPAAQVIANHFSGVDFSQRVDRYSNSNTGWLGAGYGHLGFAGMAIYAVVIGMLIRSADVLADKTSPAIAVASLAYSYVIVLFCSADVPTALLTHGVALSVIFAVLLIPLRHSATSARKKKIRADGAAGSPALSPG